MARTELPEEKLWKAIAGVLEDLTNLDPGPADAFYYMEEGIGQKTSAEQFRVFEWGYPETIAWIPQPSVRTARQTDKNAVRLLSVRYWWRDEGEFVNALARRDADRVRDALELAVPEQHTRIAAIRSVLDVAYIVVNGATLRPLNQAGDTLELQLTIEVAYRII